MSAVSMTGVTSPPRARAYITAHMFRHHGRSGGVSIEALVPKGTAQQQDAALRGHIEAGSSWCDSVIGPAVMGATADTFQETVNINRDGLAYVAPRYRPVVGVTAVAIGPRVDQLRELADLSAVSVEEQAFTVPVGVGGRLTSSAGPIEFGAISAPWRDAVIRYTVVTGYPVATMTATAAAGAIQLTVDDTTGIVAGKTWLTIYALERRHQALVTSVSTADAGGLGFGPGTIGLSSALPAAIEVADPDSAPLVSAMPPTLIDAVVLATRGIIKEAGRSSSSSTTSRSAPKSSRANAGDDFAAAEAILLKHFVLDR